MKKNSKAGRNGEKIDEDMISRNNNRKFCRQKKQDEEITIKRNEIKETGKTTIKKNSNKGMKGQLACFILFRFSSSYFYLFFNSSKVVNLQSVLYFIQKFFSSEILKYEKRFSRDL